MSNHAPHQKQENGKRGEDTARREHTDRSARSPSGGNLTLRSLHASGALRAKLRVGSPNDPAEHEADRMASAALRGGPPIKCGSRP